MADSNIPTQSPGRLHAGPMRAEPSAAATAPPPVPRTVAPPDGHQPGSTKFPRIGGSTAVSFGVSLVCHVVLLIVLAMWVFDLRIPLAELMIDGANKTGIPTELQDAPEISLTEQGGKQRTVETVPASKLLAPVTDNGKLPTDLTDSVDLSPSKTAGGGNTTGTGDDDTGKGAIPHGDMKLSRRSVRKGSFLVRWWPDKPETLKPYYLYVEITLPENLGKRYLVKDVSGEIHGNESKYDSTLEDYVQSIPFDPRLTKLGGPEYRRHTFRFDYRRKRWVWINPKNRYNYVPVVDGKVMLLFKIPGAETARIRDTIKIRSKLLKESQKLEIVF